MPKAREITLFEPLIPSALPYDLESYIGYGTGFILFGVAGLLRLYDWAAAGMGFGCLIAIVLEVYYGNFHNGFMV